jgi:hypothetical protein
VTKADGGGYLVRDNGGKYPAQPANLVDSQFVFSTNGSAIITQLFMVGMPWARMLTNCPLKSAGR